MAAQPRVFDCDSLPPGLCVPREVLQIRGLRLEPRLAYAVLWAFNGGKPGAVRIDYFAFRDALGASERAVRRWLDTLDDSGLIEILGREPRLADVFVRDWRHRANPSRRDRKTAAQSQLSLPFAEAGDEDAQPAAIPIWEHRSKPRRVPFDQPPPTAG